MCMMSGVVALLDVDFDGWTAPAAAKLWPADARSRWRAVPAGRQQVQRTVSPMFWRPHAGPRFYQRPTERGIQRGASVNRNSLSHLRAGPTDFHVAYARIERLGREFTNT